MRKITNLMVSIFLALVCNVRFAPAQSVTTDTNTDFTPIITGSTTGEKLRFAGPPEVVQLRLDVLAGTGQVVFGAQAKGNALDWSYRDETGVRLQDGTYLCLVRARTQSGQVSQRVGSLKLTGLQIELEGDTSTGVTSKSSSVIPLAFAGGTEGRLAKWTDNVGTLGDSVITEAAGKLGIGTASPNYELTVFGSDVGMQFISPGTGTTRNDGFRIGIGGTNTAFLWNNESTEMLFATSSTERMRISDGGNVGVGTASPTARLDVAGNINTSTQYNIGGNRVFSIGGPNFTFNNTFAGINAGISNTSGRQNSFFGALAGVNHTTGFGNSFFGSRAGNASTSGDGNSFFGDGTGQKNTTGALNSFFGATAGTNNTTAGGNSFFGSGAGRDNTTGSPNSFFGSTAGASNTTGGRNAFFGNTAGFKNTTGTTNSFFGAQAGFSSTTGNNNIVIGGFAGGDLISGSNNIYLANKGAEESNRIRIGTQGTQTATFIAGIRGTPVVGDAVFVDANGQLGVGAPSSLSFKQDIGAMGNASSKLMQLRPVVFHYRPEYVTGKPMPQYGLIAEEVAKVYPELVGYGVDGKPQTVRYHLLNALLLNEVQNQESHIQAHKQQLQMQSRTLADLEARLRRLEAQGTRRRRSRR